MSMSSNSAIDLFPFNLNDKSLGLLNAAIASHQVNNPIYDQVNQDESINNDTKATSGKRDLDKVDQVVTTAPKRAGRKPLQEKSQPNDGPVDPKQKRKAQNRAAQRAFRDRKEKHVAELKARIAELEALTATKDEDLIKENQQLKEMLRQLQEENYALKGAQFTFQFPVHTTKENHHQLSPNRSDSSGSHGGNSFSSNSRSNSSSGSSSSGSGTEDGTSSSAEQASPLSNNNETPLFNAIEPIQFGLIDDQSNLFNQASLTVGNDLLIHGKDDLFTNYGMPNTNTNNNNNNNTTTTAVDDFLFPNEDLSGLFGDVDLFGLDMAQQFGLPQVPTIASPADKKQRFIEKLRKAKEEGKYLYDFHQEIQQEMPDFNLDALCDDLKRKAQCSMACHTITEKEVDAISSCLDKNPTLNIF
ncbi:hypothetical protein RMATCC62417_03379 [Rhizopus microsporus]|nr:hypothetical protein RMATCC62417_03379 [Rhizopus microsporus]